MIIDKLFYVMNKKMILLIILFPFAFCLNAQEDDFSKWNIKVGYSRINSSKRFFENIGELSVEGNYRINRLYETGLYAGFSTTQSKKILEPGVEGVSSDLIFSLPSEVLSYGVNAYFHLSSLFLKENSRLGIRLIAKPGGFFVFAREDYKPSGNYLTFRAGLGVDFRLFRRIGIFAECVYGFGDGVYRAFDAWGHLDYRKHIGSFRFGMNFPF